MESKILKARLTDTDPRKWDDENYSYSVIDLHVDLYTLAEILKHNNHLFFVINREQPS